MPKPIKSLTPANVDEALDALNNPEHGDLRIIRTVHMAVPMAANDVAFMGAAFELLAANPPGPGYHADMVEPGHYDVVVAIHIRKSPNTHILH